MKYTWKDLFNDNAANDEADWPLGFYTEIIPIKKGIN